MIGANPRNFRGLLDVQPGLWRVRGLGRECYPNLVRARIDLDALKRSGIESAIGHAGQRKRACEKNRAAAP